MSRDHPKADADVTAATDGVPPPAPALRNAVAVMKPVRTRRPLLAALAVLLAAALRPAHSLLGDGLRPDFWELPALWRTLAPLAWGAGLLFVLRAATLPRRGAVLPDPTAAS